MIIHTGLVTPFVSFTKMEYKEMQTVGKRLAEIRKSNKIKQIELAEMLNVSQQVISNIEKYSLQGTTQGRYLTGGVPPVRFSM